MKQKLSFEPQHICKLHASACKKAVPLRFGLADRKKTLLHINIYRRLQSFSTKNLKRASKIYSHFKIFFTFVHYLVSKNTTMLLLLSNRYNILSAYISHLFAKLAAQMQHIRFMQFYIEYSSNHIPMVQYSCEYSSTDIRLTQSSYEYSFSHMWFAQNSYENSSAHIRLGQYATA